MATEVGALVIELEVKLDKLQRGLDRANQRIDRFAKNGESRFKRLNKAVSGVVSKLTKIAVGSIAVGLAATSAAFAAITKSAISAASEVETFQIRLQNLIGSTAQANQLLRDMSEFAQEVAPSLRDIIEATATLGTVSLGSARSAENLTRTAANISAVTGLTLVQSAQNLQRALSSGIGAADLFRERGVRAILESVTGMANLIDKPISVVRDAFEETFGPSGVFADAASAFANTLPGSISRTGDALFKFRSTLGAAFSPALQAFLNEVLIPGFNKLTEVIAENREGLGELARRGLVVASKGFLLFAQGVLKATQLFTTFEGALGEFQLDDLRKQLDRERRRLQAFERGGDAEQIAEQETVVDSLGRQIETLTTRQDTLANSNRELATTFDALNGFIEEQKVAVNDLGKETVAANQKAREDAEAELARLRDRFANQAVTQDSRQVKAVESALKRQINLLEKLRLEEIAVTSEERARIEELKNLNTTLDDGLRSATANIDNLRNALKLAELEAELANKAIGEDPNSTANQEQQVTAAKRVAAVNRQVAEAEARVAETRIATSDRIKQNNLDIAKIQRDLVTTQDAFNKELNTFLLTKQQVGFLDQEEVAKIEERLEGELAIASTVQERLEAAQQANESLDKLFEKTVDFTETLG